MENNYMDYNVSEKETDTVRTEKNQKIWGGKKIAALAACCVVLGGAAGGAIGGGLVYASSQGRDQIQEDVKDELASTVMEGVRGKSVLNVAYIDTSREIFPWYNRSGRR